MILCSRPLGPDRADRNAHFVQPPLTRSEEEASITLLARYEINLPGSVEAFAAIYAIVPRYEQQMAAVESAGERSLPEAAARHAIHRAIDRLPGISREEYDEIATGMREDPTLDAAVREALEERFAATEPRIRRPPARGGVSGNDHAAPPVAP